MIHASYHISTAHELNERGTLVFDFGRAVLASTYLAYAHTYFH